MVTNMSFADAPTYLVVWASAVRRTIAEGL